MKYLVLSLGKFIFQVSIVIFIIGYCFGFWFKGNDKTQKKVKPKFIKPSTRPILAALEIEIKAA